MCEVDFFEGPEKLMEIWWGSLQDENASKSGDLRTIPREKWEKVLELVNCQIISETHNDDMIAYLLSESSMFISKTRVILKTCGTTTLLYAIKPLMQLADRECGLTVIQDFFYSRMNFLEPELQQAPHQSFDQEAKWLDDLFSNGAAYALGRINSHGCWYLYTLHNVAPGVQEPDQTLEILMQELDPRIMKKFFKEEGIDVKKVTEISGIKDFVPGAIIDDALFEPCGYSMNGLINVTALENNVVHAHHSCSSRLLRDTYFTIHITPQENCSYVSFETNLKLICYKELIDKVLDAFKPGKFLMTLFANQGAPCGSSIKTFEDYFAGYKRNDLQLCQMKNYNLTYGHYEKVSEINGIS